MQDLTILAYCLVIWPRSTPRPESLLVHQMQPYGLSHYRLISGKGDSLSAKFIAHVPPIKTNFGGWVLLRPDPNGRTFAWEGHEGSGRAGGLELWSVNPLKRIARLTTGPLREIRWLYGRPALAVAEMRFNRPPKVTLISTQTGKVLKILEGCVAVTDKPGSTTVLALRTAHSSVTFQPWLTTSPNPDTAKMLLDGNIRPEESEDLQNWRPVSLEEAGNRWVFRGAGPKSLATLLAPWEQRLGFKDHWLIPRYKVYPERKGGDLAQGRRRDVRPSRHQEPRLQQVGQPNPCVRRSTRWLVRSHQRNGPEAPPPALLGRSRIPRLDPSLSTRNPSLARPTRQRVVFGPLHRSMALKHSIPAR
jgi:hypothetical protein